MLVSTLLFASTATATCLHGLSMFKKRAEGAVEVNTFGYAALNGPFNWATLAPENEACRAGTNQSPINIDDSVTVAAEKPVLNIPEQEVEFENLGTTIEVVVNGTTTMLGSEFQLVQFHMHTPSEHHVNGEYHPLEVHMVHQGVADNTQLAVVALMFQVSTGDSASIISSLSSSIAAITVPGSTTTIGDGIDFTDVIAKIASSDVLQYSGSLTTPPCAEGVNFLIVKDPLDISVADYNAIKSVVKFNSRFIQNSLGQENILEVGARSGSATAIGAPAPAPAEGNGTETAPVEEAAVPTPGSKFVVTELEGKVRGRVRISLDVNVS
ncbi:alpha carbonic anhydrase [Paraphoma chrysanthemicola]|nr:alpha carbonic anhydrase [Paraphoma chrysanthemicola]